MYLAVIVPLVLAAVAAIALTRITRDQVGSEPSRTAPALATTE